MNRMLYILLFVIFSNLLIAQQPEWQWASQAGGDYLDSGVGITLDENNNCYVIGSFHNTATFGSYSISSNGGIDIFIAKMDDSGNWLWAISAGGNSADLVLDVVIDAGEFIYVTGSFEDTATFGSYTLTCNGNRDIFVAKIDTLGNWMWAINPIGNITEGGSGISVDEDSNIFITGYFCDTLIWGSHSLTSNGGDDIFVSKIDQDGNCLWVNQAGGLDHDYGKKISLDSDGNSYITGSYNDSATFGSYSISSSGESDIFIAKMDENGNWLWVNNASSSSIVYVGEIAIDNEFNNYIIGTFEETAIFGQSTLSSDGETDIFIAKIDNEGYWVWAIKSGGNYYDQGIGIIINDGVDIFVTGSFKWAAEFGEYLLNSNGTTDIFVAKIDSGGNWLWVTQAGEPTYNVGIAIEVDNSGDNYVTGYFDNSIIFGSNYLNSFGYTDIFVAKLDNPVSINNEIFILESTLLNYPNPFNPSTAIKFSIQNDSTIKLTIFNIKGQKIKTLAQNEYAKGEHTIIWNGDDEFNEPVSSGVYLYKLNVNDKTEAVKKCLLLK